ncbi:crotonase/enoyl-CoA hydratase family protein [Actibacterium lipolyticum]|uniref:Putative enoyl-CoA hydratase echA8 n=1 Tax=Actibacterium lipolyticum TaxID=1524263 RepID=A0A238JSC1_9RHOB|nr:crotonase/enoyl-CoA hydratase family protein [Actibacterium lipolyticum]SMX33077.1 putative enoyl-CoA hydratase echA8 [Actibacterium lipolyticum]
MSDLLTITTNGHVAELCLNRPEKKNALNFDLLDALTAAGEDLKTRKDIRAVILHGAGGAFSAGIDLMLLQSLATRLDEIKQQMRNPPEGEVANLFQKPITVWQELQLPVIAALDGVCFGAGMQLALGADFRIAAPDTKLSIMEAKWGLIPDMGISQSLPRLVRPDVAKELVMTGRIFDGAEALSMGLVTRLADDPLAEARALAETLAERAPDAVQRAKVLVDTAWGATAAEGLALEAELQAQIIGGPNQMEAVMASLQKRKPAFK